jgi:PAS domain S-box-containing protein
MQPETRFTMLTPVGTRGQAKTEVAVNPKPQPKRQPQPSGQRRRRNTSLRVLFVDLSKSDRDLCRRELEKARFHVVGDSVETRVQFAKKVRSEEYDVILSEHKRRSWTTGDAPEILRREGKSTPVILVSRTLGPEAAAECIKKGFTDYISKDYLYRLALAVKHALRESALRKERNRAYQDSQVRERNFRLLFANNPHPMWVWDRETLRFLEVNDAAVDLYGYSRDEFLAMRIGDIRPPEDVPRFMEAMASDRPRTVYHREWRHRVKAGRIIDVETSSHALAAGWPNAILVVGQDITERKRAEEGQARLAAILEATSDIVSIADPHGSILYVNGGGRKMLGLGEDPASTLGIIGKWHTEWSRALLQEVALPTAIRDGSWWGESSFLASDGREIPVSQVIVAHKGPDGAVLFFSTIARDITDCKRAEEEIRELNKDLEKRVTERTAQLAAMNSELELRNREVEHATQLKSQFLARMSHDLRTPVNAILGFSELLVDGIAGLLTEKQKHYVDHIHAGGQHLLQLVNDILDLSKIEAGRLELRTENLPMTDAVAEAVSLIRPLALAKKILLETVTDPGLEIHADRVRLKQIFYNLLSNAVKFTPDEGAIRVTASGEAGFARITVEDSGIGIDPQHIEIIFDEFQQVGTSARGLKEGTGLGLTITRRLVEKHGGRIWVESAPDEGSRFTFTLPLAPVSLPEPPVPAAHPVRARPLVLIVEDDPGARELLIRYLEREGYEIAVAANGSEAIAQALLRLPDIITLNVLTAEQSGWETLRQLKNTSETAGIPVIIVSVVDQKETGFALGAADYLVKPVSREILVHAVETHLGHRKEDCLPVLIVDDDPEDLQTIAELLESEGYVCLRAQSGPEALQAVGKRRPGVILLDLLMHGMDGFQVIRSIRENSGLRDIPIVVLTAKNLTEPDIELLSRETQAFFRKSTSWKDALLAQIHQVLGQARSSP